MTYRKVIYNKRKKERRLFRNEDVASAGNYIISKHFGEYRNLPKYNLRFNELDIDLLKDYKVPPKLANSYPPHLSTVDICMLYINDCPPSIIKRYLPTFCVDTIAWLYGANITPENMSPEHQNTLKEVLNKISMSIGERGDYSLLGTGTHAVVVLNKENSCAHKFSKSLGEEIRLLEKIRERFTNPKNLVSLKKVVERGSVEERWSVDVIELEYVQGKTLQQILDKEKIVFNFEQTLNYSEGIFHGLLELKECRIFHRDLWLGNIMIDDVKDRAVIIDLGIASDEPDAKPKGNRRYGGENDLQSLGQIMYKMVTGHHLFNPSICRSTHLIPDEIKAERERIYADPASLDYRLKQVEENVLDKKVAEIIQICLTAKGSEGSYKKLEGRFREYGA